MSLWSQQDSELMELRETIELLQTKNTEAQAVIHVALNNPDIAPKGRRQDPAKKRKLFLLSFLQAQQIS